MQRANTSQRNALHPITDGMARDLTMLHMATNNSQRHDDVVQILHLHRYSMPPHNQDVLFPITVTLHPGYCYRGEHCFAIHDMRKLLSVYQSSSARIVLPASVVVSVLSPLLPVLSQKIYQGSVPLFACYISPSTHL
jgi:hypothetical protein